MEFNRIVTQCDPAASRQNKQRKRRVWTSSERARFVAQWQASGLSQGAFCQRYDLNRKSLSRWYNALRPEGSKKKPQLQFCAQSTVVDEPVRYVMRLPNGVSFVLSGQHALAGLRALLQEVMSCTFS